MRETLPTNKATSWFFFFFFFFFFFLLLFVCFFLLLFFFFTIRNETKWGCHGVSNWKGIWDSESNKLYKKYLSQGVRERSMNFAWKYIVTNHDQSFSKQHQTMIPPEAKYIYFKWGYMHLSLILLPPGEGIFRLALDKGVQVKSLKYLQNGQMVYSEKSKLNIADMWLSCFPWSCHIFVYLIFDTNGVHS